MRHRRGIDITAGNPMDPATLTGVNVWHGRKRRLQKQTDSEQFENSFLQLVCGLPPLWGGDEAAVAS